MKSFFEQNGGTYTKVGDYYFPDLQVEKTNISIGKYGRLHKKFIMENHPVMYSALVLSGNLSDYLHQVDLKAKKELTGLISLLAEKQGVTEQLKAENQLQWVGLMNNIKEQAEEFIYTNRVYNRNLSTAYIKNNSKLSNNVL